MEIEMELEMRLRDLLASGDHATAATQVIKGYGPEVMGFLLAFVGDRDGAEEALAQASFDLWLSIGTFGQRASLRTWFYTLARHAAARLRRAAHRRPGRQVSLDQVAELEAAQGRSATAPHLRTGLKSAFVAIREALAPDDRALLVLRVDRQMSWSDIARIIANDSEPDSVDSIKRRAAFLRKRFQLVKADIRDRALAAGLLQEA